MADGWGTSLFKKTQAGWGGECRGPRRGGRTRGEGKSATYQLVSFSVVLPLQMHKRSLKSITGGNTAEEPEHKTSWLRGGDRDSREGSQAAYATRHRLGTSCPRQASH